MFGAIARAERIVEQLASRIVTAAGVSSGIDMALRLIELITDRRTAQGIQLWTKCDHQPPYAAGFPAEATADVQELAADYAAAALAAAIA